MALGGKVLEGAVIVAAVVAYSSPTVSLVFYPLCGIVWALRGRALAMRTRLVLGVIGAALGAVGCATLTILALRGVTVSDFSTSWFVSTLAWMALVVGLPGLQMRARRDDFVKVSSALTSSSLWRSVTSQAIPDLRRGEAGQDGA
jgi:hypothetical protein